MNLASIEDQALYQAYQIKKRQQYQGYLTFFQFCEDEKIKKQKANVIPYPRTSSFAWSNKGKLVTFAYQKYDFNNMDKTSQKKMSEGSIVKKEKDQREKKGNKFLNPKEI